MKPIRKPVLKKQPGPDTSKRAVPANSTRRSTQRKSNSNTESNSPPPKSGPELATDQPLNPSELKEIDAILSGEFDGKEIDDLWINSTPSTHEFGRLASCPEAQLLHWMDMAIQGVTDKEPTVPPDKFVRHVFDFILDQFINRDHRFFAGISALLRARKDKRQLSPKELGYAEKPGRKTQAYDLGHAANIAVSTVLQYRVFLRPPDGKGLRKFRITRDELQHEIRSTREYYGLKPSDSKVSEFELSRIITKHKLRPFMAKR